MELELSLSPPNQKRQPKKKSSHGYDHEAINTFFNEEYQEFIEENYIDDIELNGRVEEEADNIKVMNNNNNNELFVKVKMDGVGIARKINLNIFHSYQMLTTTLIHMFDKYVEIEEDGASYELMYQHKDGHWLLAGDLPWEIFIHTVKRMHMVRS
ncbi:PB1 domain, AUX/IAA protein [Artemisia annua]|uniref:Auxin-responsive protein n=1 Tax=Artemisia annua TaxID=35608 RepID=A0A2U1NJP8_ARTAN|nr:PB1 domain, AUX/IAA protein [Artemisia annua]